MKIVWTGKLYEVAHAELQRRNMEVTAYGQRDIVNEDSFVAALSGCEIYVNGGFEAASERVLRNSPTLQPIIYLGADAASYIDLPNAKSLGIVVRNTPGAKFEISGRGGDWSGGFGSPSHGACHRVRSVEELAK